MIFGMGPMELAVILLVVLVIFGPKNLPKLGSALGKTVKNVREGMEDELPADEADQPSSDEADQR
uniref:twin-arginine translocase TatA/TatE family subunit n=1 Tax=Olsenella timonensis TaxID=1805478 RepID=UPI00094EA399|nr:twin-arginine translocase TatA/TatE family subunit [Olsenella timonensis]